MQTLPKRCLKFVLTLLFSFASLLALGQDVQINPANQTPPLPQAPSMSIKPYHSISGRQRLSWLLQGTLGPPTLAVGLFSEGLGTARDSPHEYGPHWDGFAKRYGMRLTGIATSNVMEAGIGSIWGEDPRYFRTYRQPIKGRIRNVVVMTFLAHNREGALTPAYARYSAVVGSNFLSNTWRADSEATNGAASLRSVYGFLGLMGTNAFTEFWPDVKTRIFHRKK